MSSPDLNQRALNLPAGQREREIHALAKDFRKIAPGMAVVISGLGHFRLYCEARDMSG
jgi:hypothetical protein